MTVLDGTFFMPFKEWVQRFNHLLVAVNVPKSWTTKKLTGVWNGESGGHRGLGTWVSHTWGQGGQGRSWLVKVSRHKFFITFSTIDLFYFPLFLSRIISVLIH